MTWLDLAFSPASSLEMRERNMKVRWVSLILFILVGCGTTKALAPLPKIQDTNQVAKIHIVRPPRFAADGASYMLQMDGIFVLQMRPNYYTTFMVNPGKHTLTLAAETFWHGLQVENARLNCEPRDVYYFKITPAGLTQVTEEIAKPLMDKYKYIPAEYDE
jgi:hypothetical protein